MRRLNYAVPKLAAVTILRSVFTGALVLLFTIVLGSLPVNAKPRVTGDNCDFTTIDNSKKVACEDKCDSCRVACVASGEAFCCRDNASGGLDCESLTSSSAGLKGVEAALALISRELQDLKIKLDEPNVCAAPDFLPLGIIGQTGPTSFCRIVGPDQNSEYHLQVIAYNQGASETDLSGTITRVVFNTPDGALQYDMSTSTLASGVSQTLAFNIPAGCWPNPPTADACSFTITVNATDTATPDELILTNNTALGECNVIL